MKRKLMLLLILIFVFVTPVMAQTPTQPPTDNVRIPPAVGWFLAIGGGWVFFKIMKWWTDRGDPRR